MIPCSNIMKRSQHDSIFCGVQVPKALCVIFSRNSVYDTRPIKHGLVTGADYKRSVPKWKSGRYQESGPAVRLQDIAEARMALGRDLSNLS